MTADVFTVAKLRELRRKLEQADLLRHARGEFLYWCPLCWTPWGGAVPARCPTCKVKT